MSQVLNVKNLTQRFGGLVALEHVDMCVNEGEIVGIIGPNGACLLYTSPSPRD